MVARGHAQPSFIVPLFCSPPSILLPRASDYRKHHHFHNLVSSIYLGNLYDEADPPPSLLSLCTWVTEHLSSSLWLPYREHI